MVTIKDVASFAQVSPTTVSLIINGKAEERRISPLTCERVMQAMNILGYQPNLSARRLRSNEKLRPIIAFLLAHGLPYQHPGLIPFQLPGNHTQAG